jgi:hypothetical protein
MQGGPIMYIDEILGIVIEAPRADKAAVGAIHRPLQIILYWECDVEG